MKKLLYIPAILLFAACSQPKDKKAQLTDLKKQQADLSAKISKLEKEVGTTDSVKSTDVAVMDVQKQSFTNYINLQGKIDAKDNVQAFPQAQAVITAIYVKVGDHVNKGQTLVQLDNSVLKQNIAQAQTQADLAKTLFERQKNLWDQKIGTEVQYLQAQSNMQSAQKQVASLREQSDMYRIVSPITGTVDQMDLKLGQAASPATTFIRIVNTDYLKVKADVPESYSSNIKLGDKVNVVVPDANDSLMAKVTFAGRVIDPSSRSFPIEIQLPGRKTLRPNMTVVLKIADYSKSNAIVVPINAIQKSENGDYVFINVNNTARKKVITEGASYGGLVEVKTGLNVGDKLITDGSTEVEDGDKVKVLQPGN
ncbi:efflux RND transporter periplasmic adaptor subunit [Mucilaginibacter ginsenosidivorans]|uniref:Efflux RND transporter periplasmic adaptor subunit n=1 Tax=Mucilaginibacter ginsenosidivorans TaxID=398053 RepID=A0A5B8V1Q7_9SPHI|nr:efflux RND transporter periplasmic adaptor subunit [Mucilaginibacter ginsenosidivorans]QEC64496.1 efflux RND transporter periplasmic adaptor subunit [Mucilaginibacter ginsenosidivorans]